MEVVAGVSDAIDSMLRPGDRSDLGEISQMSLIETLADLVN
jgi:hypothetical protein